ncbi:MAG: hypothetical protein GYA21_01875, partial [Myxococcales bacterium]|nr:hypothetical protein [Myxococcales bacterium]
PQVPAAPPAAQAPAKFPLPAPTRPAVPATRPPAPVPPAPAPAPVPEAPTAPAAAASIPGSYAAWRPPSQTRIYRPPAPEEVPAPEPKPRTGVTVRPRVEAAPAPARELPPEVLAARRLAEKPVANTAGPTIFGEDLISEKSLDEVILSYLSGEADEKR